MKKLLFPLSILLLVFSGCKKDANSINGKIKSYTFVNTGAVTNATNSNQCIYNTQGQLTERDAYNSDGSLHSKFTVTYSGNNVYSSYYDSINTSPYITDTAILNAQRYMISNGSGGSRATFTYDGSGHLLTATNNGFATVKTWSSGNMITDSSASNEVISYTYLNKTDYRDFGQSYLGKSSTNLPATVYNSYTAQTGTYTYVYDNKGRVASVTVSYGAGNANAQGPYTISISYTYFD